MHSFDAMLLLYTQEVYMQRAANGWQPPPLGPLNQDATATYHAFLAGLVPPATAEAQTRLWAPPGVAPQVGYHPPRGWMGGAPQPSNAPAQQAAIRRSNGEGENLPTFCVGSRLYFLI